MATEKADVDLATLAPEEIDRVVQAFGLKLDAAHKLCGGYSSVNYRICQTIPDCSDYQTGADSVLLRVDVEMRNKYLSNQRQFSLPFPAFWCSGPTFPYTNRTQTRVSDVGCRKSDLLRIYKVGVPFKFGVKYILGRLKIHFVVRQSLILTWRPEIYTKYTYFGTLNLGMDNLVELENLLYCV